MHRRSATDIVFALTLGGILMPTDPNCAQLMNPVAKLQGTTLVALNGTGDNFIYPNFSLDSGYLVFDSDPTNHIPIQLITANNTPYGGTSPYSVFTSVFRYSPPNSPAQMSSEGSKLLGVGKLRITITNYPNTVNPGEGAKADPCHQFYVDTDVS
jgi:hypothetical protein